LPLLSPFSFLPSPLGYLISNISPSRIISRVSILFCYLLPLLSPFSFLPSPLGYLISLGSFGDELSDLLDLPVRKRFKVSAKAFELVSYINSDKYK